jgi:hypothetical protein
VYIHNKRKEKGATHTVLKGAADGLENPVLSDVNKAIVPLLANSNPAKCNEDAKAIPKAALGRPNNLSVPFCVLLLMVDRRKGAQDLTTTSY